MPRYDADAAVAWKAANVRPRVKVAKSAAAATPDLLAARTRREEAQAAIAEIELARLRGTLVSAEDVTAAASNSGAAVSRALDTLVARMESRLSADDARALRAEVHDLRLSVAAAVEHGIEEATGASPADRG